MNSAPLPARPPPQPPAKASEDVEMVNVTIKEERDPVDTASTVSSQTLVEEASDRSYEKVETSPSAAEDRIIDTVMEIGPDGDTIDSTLTSFASTATVETIKKEPNTTIAGDQSTDVNMIDAEEPETVDQKVLSALEHQKRSSGTDQQDVEEVMGSILNRLQAAIQASSVDKETGIQLEKIMETFFVTTINYTKKFDDQTYQREISFDRSITAFPAPEGTCSLYDALGRNFDQQIIEESKLSRYTAIKTLPPVLHVLIQRSQSMGSKNGNPVEIPETLYLDRYMDAPHDSPTFRDRVGSWAIASRISDLKVQKAKVESVIPTGPFLETCGNDDEADGSIAAAALENGLPASDEENWDFDGPVDDDFLLVNHPTRDPAPVVDLPPKPARIKSVEARVREMMDQELHVREQELAQYHAKLKNIPYRLHAVICHRGQLMSGHYWVWIHDFEQKHEVLATLSTSGEPYFLCYVQDTGKEEYVDVPRRQRPPPSREPTTDADGDVTVSNNELKPRYRDIEREVSPDPTQENRLRGVPRLMREAPLSSLPPKPPTPPYIREQLEATSSTCSDEEVDSDEELDSEEELDSDEVPHDYHDGYYKEGDEAVVQEGDSDKRVYDKDLVDSSTSDSVPTQQAKEVAERERGPRKRGMVKAIKSQRRRLRAMRESDPQEQL
ncbi:hypothetical protein NM208_g12251 [Fusarium decemcellulare]|uniref:Uncharacterized protein n=2 Tax=Fusarium decemcellulare TaxID=57161 RepID=A0ACC1RPD2_9HYPO|nr:hypothetical protein NM208_g12251 [Fusarium decemcellulare]